ncbi:MAG: heavy metal translocating P-type ATPase [Clostridia bacterium]|nr:heavy metal translocating P-type ATPase [Clostridia bacterium]
MEQYNVTGMSCAACSARVEKAVSALENVTECSVNLLTNSMNVSGTATEQEIIAAVVAAGYGASKKGSKQKTAAEDELKDTETPKLVRRLVTSVGFLALLMYISMGHSMWGWPLPAFFEGNPVATAMAQMLLTIAVMIINGKFFVSGFKGLVKGAPNMDTLVALGSAAAFGYSTVVLFLMTAQTAEEAMHSLHGLYFESAAMILTLITVGKMLEARAKGKTTDALKGLMRLAPKTANVIRDGKEITVPVSDVNRGDIFVVRPGESIPCDGILADGGGAVDESALTGESLPVDKTVGSHVYAATINKSGFLTCEATHVGEDTTFSGIIKMVSDAAATKAPVAKMADKVSGIFVPTVIAIAAITFAVWMFAGQTVGFALARGISVLVISCPCALGLATPVAIMVASGVGAKNGILFKTAASLEQTGKVKVVALDKTGTITRGEPSVTDVIPCGTTETELVSIAASLESKSEHPLGKAVIAYAAEKGIAAPDSENFEAVAGKGLTANVNGETAHGGSLSYISSLVNLTTETVSAAEKLASEGKTPIMFCHGGKYIGIIAVADTVKEDSAAAIKAFKSLGIRTVMLTGDNERTAKAIAEKVGIDEVRAGILPQNKAEAVKELSVGGMVAMVGDGINDAPALTSADIGIAIGAGADVAIDAADVVLMHSSLVDAVSAVRLSRKTLRNIRENLFWAFIYNIIGIPLAAGVWIPLFGLEMDPMFGAAAMSLSSFCVVMNALRLNFFKADKRAESAAAVTLEKEIKIEGMMCGHCEAAVKKCLEALSGVTEAAASHKDGIATVKLSADVADNKLKKAVEAEGYKVKEICTKK